MSTPLKSQQNIVYNCGYQIVFCSMYRRKVLTPPIDERLKTMVMQIIEKWGQEFIEIEVRPNDYVHLLVGCDPQFGTGGKLVKYIKEASSHQLRKEFSALKRRLPSL